MIQRLTLALLISLSTQLHALPDDEFQQIKIQADGFVQDEKQQLTTYQGNVIIEQGSLRIEANTIIIKNGKDQSVENMIAHGKPARFQQQPSQDKGIVFAEANKIEYNTGGGKIELTGNARLNQDESKVSSEYIVYLTNEQVFKAKQLDSTVKPSRVEVIIPARKKPVTDKQQDNQPKAQ